MDWESFRASLQLARFEILSKGCSSQDWENFLWTVVEKAERKSVAPAFEVPTRRKSRRVGQPQSSWCRLTRTFTLLRIAPALYTRSALCSTPKPDLPPTGLSLVSESASECASSEGNVSYRKMVCLGCALFAATSISSSAQAFKTLV